MSVEKYLALSAMFVFVLLFASCDFAERDWGDGSPGVAAERRRTSGEQSVVSGGRADDWCAGHDLPESMCTQCNPELVARFQAAEDWCAAHGFPESACPQCNPLSPPESRDVDSDWCVEHALPESQCTQCDPALVDAFREGGDWCPEHGFPESSCPRCNPQRPPVGASLGAPIYLEQAAVSDSGIRHGRVQRASGTSRLRLAAEVRADPDRVAHVSTLVSGRLEAVSVTVGDVVEAGDTLAVVRSVELAHARAALRSAEAARSLTRRALGRQRELRDAGVNAERELLRARSAFQQADAERDAAYERLRVLNAGAEGGVDLVVTSPISGVILERHATEGENISPEDTLFVVNDVSQLWVIGRVYEGQAADVREGMAATISVDAYPNETWSGRVDYVGAALDEATRSLPVRVRVNNEDGRLRRGFFAEMTLSSEGESSSDAVWVSEAAVQTINEQSVVFVPRARPGEYLARIVEVGRYDAGLAEVMAGLSLGEEVVIEGAFVLKSQLLRHTLGEGCAH